MKIEEYVRKLHMENVLTDPDKIFNVDETSFCVNPRLRKVLTKRGAKNVHIISVENDKDAYTALLGGKWKHF